MDSALKANLVTELKLDRLPEAQREEAIIKIGGIILKSVLVRAINELDEAGQEELGQLMETNPDDPESIFSFLRSKLPDFEEIFQDEVAAVKRDMLGTMNGPAST